MRDHWASWVAYEAQTSVSSRVPGFKKNIIYGRCIYLQLRKLGKKILKKIILEEIPQKIIQNMCHGQKSQYWGWSSHLLIGILVMGI